MIMPSFDRWDGRWGVDWKKRGDDEATADPFLWCWPLGVACEGWIGVEDCDLREE